MATTALPIVLAALIAFLAAVGAVDGPLMASIGSSENGNEIDVFATAMRVHSPLIVEDVSVMELMQSMSTSLSTTRAELSTTTNVLSTNTAELSTTRAELSAELSTASSQLSTTNARLSSMQAAGIFTQLATCTSFASHPQFPIFQQIDTSGATSWKSCMIGNTMFLAVANFYNSATTSFITKSNIYRFDIIAVCAAPAARYAWRFRLGVLFDWQHQLPCRCESPRQPVFHHQVRHLPL